MLRQVIYINLVSLLTVRMRFLREASRQKGNLKPKVVKSLDELLNAIEQAHCSELTIQVTIRGKPVLNQGIIWGFYLQYDAKSPSGDAVSFEELYATVESGEEHIQSKECTYITMLILTAEERAISIKRRFPHLNVGVKVSENEEENVKIIMAAHTYSTENKIQPFPGTLEERSTIE